MKVGVQAKNLSWNLVGGVWNGMLLLVLTPFYILKLGLVGYGAVSLWITLQAVMMILDFGLGPALLKEMAAEKEKINVIFKKGDALRTVELAATVLAGGISGALILAIYMGAFGRETPDLVGANIFSTIERSTLAAMICALAIQFPYWLYFNGLLGLQKHRDVNLLHIFGNTFRYGSAAIFLCISTDLFDFFVLQIGVSICITLLARFVMWYRLDSNKKESCNLSIKELGRLLKFGIGMAFTSIAAILLSNIDKLSLGFLVPSDQFSKYSIAASAIAMLQLGIQPIHRVFFPRYIAIAERKDSEAARSIYLIGCELLAAGLIPISIVSFFFAPSIFNIWLGFYDEQISDAFRLLILGVTLASLMWLPAAFQQACNITWLHFSMMVLALVVGVPLMIFLTARYGFLAGSVVWITHGLIEISLGLWLMHKFFFVGEGISWIKTVIMPPFVISFIIVGFSWLMHSDAASTVVQLFWIIATTAVALGCSCIPYISNSEFKYLKVEKWRAK